MPRREHFAAWGLVGLLLSSVAWWFVYVGNPPTLVAVERRVPQTLTYTHRGEVLEVSLATPRWPSEDVESWVERNDEAWRLWVEQHDRDPEHVADPSGATLPGADGSADGMR